MHMHACICAYAHVHVEFFEQPVSTPRGRMRSATHQLSINKSGGETPQRHRKLESPEANRCSCMFSDEIDQLSSSLSFRLVKQTLMFSATGAPISFSHVKFPRAGHVSRVGMAVALCPDICMSTCIQRVHGPFTFSGASAARALKSRLRLLRTECGIKQTPGPLFLIRISSSSNASSSWPFNHHNIYWQ